MRNITVSIADGLYRRARERAAAEDTSLSRVVAEYLESWAGREDDAVLKQRLQRLFQEADQRDKRKRKSAGPFSRQELYATRLKRFR